jgi:hypothetical protein
MKTSQTLFRLFLLSAFVFLGIAGPEAFSQTRRSLDMQKYSTNTRRFYDHRGGFRKNTVKIQLAQLVNTGRLTYERAITRKIAVGVNWSYQYAGVEAGTTKYDIYGRWYLTHRSPIGLFLYSGFGNASIKNHTFQYRMTETEGGVELKYDAKRPYVVERTGSFTTYTGCFGAGFQNVLGYQKRIVLDFAAGYQFYFVPEEFKTPITANQLVYGKFDPNNGILGPTSPLQVKVGLGFLF